MEMATQILGFFVFIYFCFFIYHVKNKINELKTLYECFNFELISIRQSLDIINKWGKKTDCNPIALTSLVNHTVGKNTLSKLSERGRSGFSNDENFEENKEEKPKKKKIKKHNKNITLPFGNLSSSCFNIIDKLQTYLLVNNKEFYNKKELFDLIFEYAQEPIDSNDVLHLIAHLYNNCTKFSFKEMIRGSKFLSYNVECKEYKRDIKNYFYWYTNTHDNMERTSDGKWMKRK